VPTRFRRTATVTALILALGSLPVLASTVAANADEVAGAPTSAAPTVTTPGATTVPSAAAPAARETPTLKLEYLGQSRYGRAQFQVTFTPDIYPDPRSDYPTLSLRVDGLPAFASDGFGDDGVSPVDVVLDAGHYTARAVTSENGRFNAAMSTAIEFDVSGPRATKLTLVPPTNPVANVKYPYTVRVSPSEGSTARVNLSQYDNVGQLQYIGYGYLKNGQVTINAAAWPGQRRIVAEFTGDDSYAVSGTAVDIFFPVGPAAEADPPAVPVPSATSAPAAPSSTPSVAPAVTTSSASAAGELAYTGANLWPGATLAAVLLAAGVALRTFLRRRRA
jgi:hypothetical protein